MALLFSALVCFLVRNKDASAHCASSLSSNNIYSYIHIYAYMSIWYGITPPPSNCLSLSLHMHLCMHMYVYMSLHMAIRACVFMYTIYMSICPYIYNVT